MSETFRAIIIAAGVGSRLQSHTADKPKCLLNFGSKTLLQIQLDAYRATGITDVHLIRGYRGECIDNPNIVYHDNPNFRENNILNSLFCAESALTGYVLIGYSDILFRPSVVAQLIESPFDISLVVDIEWRRHYFDRKHHPIAEAELVSFRDDGTVERIGKGLESSKDGRTGEFIGMLKLTPRGSSIFKEEFHAAERKYLSKPFQMASSFQNAYLTDFVQELSDCGIGVHCSIIRGGWKEIDTVEDYENALGDWSM